MKKLGCLLTVLLIGVIGYFFQDKIRALISSDPVSNHQNKEDQEAQEYVQANQSFKKSKKITESGYEFIHLNTGGKKVKEGDYVSVTYSMVGSDGKVIQEIGEGPNMPIMQIPSPEKPNTNRVIDMLKYGTLGDSMTLIMPLDSFPNGSTTPQLAGLEYIEYRICIKKISDEATHIADLEKARMKKSKEIAATKARKDEVAAKSEKILKDYKAGKLDIRSTTDGLKYVILAPGNGARALAGTKVRVHYYGLLMDGKMFDTSFRNGRPYAFEVASNSVIKGWDIGIPLLKKGGKAALFLPYDLAYGERGSPPSIPPKSDLMFYIELVDVN